MASATFSSLPSHSSSFPFSHTPFPVDSLYQNLDISEQTTDGDDSDDGDYSSAGVVPRKPRFFKVKYAPEAVVNWYRIALDKNTDLKKSAVKEDALGHLLAMGWKTYYYQKKDKQELRYKSPNGRVYISLRTACKGYIDESGAAAAATPPVKVSDHSPTEKKESLPPVASSEKPKNDSGRIKSPAPPVRNWGKEKTPAAAPVRNWGKEKTPAAAPVRNWGKEKTPAAAPVRNWGNEKTPAEPPVRNWGKEKTPAAPPVKGTSRRNLRSALSYMIEQGLVSAGDRVYYKLASKDDPFLAKGSITNEGLIKCDCCSKLFSMSNFEAHSGSTKRRPAANIFLEDGRSLLDCKKQLVQNENKTNPIDQKVNNNNNANSHSDTFCLDKNDHICSICLFGGDLILCDMCPAAFHGSCLGFKGIPFGDWFCPSCCCKICGQVPYTFDGVSSNLQSNASFVKCVQCEQNVHIGCVNCVRVLEDNSNQNINTENWFCTKRCEDVHMGLQKLLWKQIPVGKEKDHLTWTLMKHTDMTMAQHHRKKLNIALGVLHESFRPVKDPITKSDLIEDVLFSRRSVWKRLNFEGFYTVVLERRKTVTTVATVRVYGDEVAEVPFVATRSKHRRHGMCRTLMNELEQQLMELGVRTLTLPAVAEALNTWTDGFGFSKMTDSDRLELVKYTLLGFQHTVRCQKSLEERIPNDLEWGPRKRLKQTGLEDEIFDDWSSISDAFAW